MDEAEQSCSGCLGCAARDKVIADQARTLERVTSELRWHGLDDDALTVAQGFEAYERARQGDKSWPVYKRLLAPLLRRFGSLPCLQVNAEKWAEHRAARAVEPCGRWGKRRPTSGHLDQELTLARMMFGWLVADGKLPRNPLVLAKRVNAPSERETYLEAADVQRLHDGAPTLDDGTERGWRRVLLFRAFVLVLFRGLRFEEARWLRRDRIVDGVVELSAKRTKGKRRRTVALRGKAMAAIEALPLLKADPRIFTHEGKSGGVVMVSKMAMRDWFDRVCAATGVEHRAVEGERVVPHCLRHSAASHAELMGAHPVDIQDFLGHASLKTTEKYLHRRAAQRALATGLLMDRKPARRSTGKIPEGQANSS